jgi:hypothetical protein
MPVGLVIMRVIISIVHFIVSFALGMILFLVTFISVADNVAQVSFSPISVTLHWGCDAAGRVAVQALAVVRVLTLPHVSAISVGSIVATSSILCRCLTCALTYSLSCNKGVSWA